MDWLARALVVLSFLSFISQWRELPQVFLSRQTRVLLWQKYACRNKTFVATNIILFCFDKKVLSRQERIYFCCDKSFVATKLCLSQQIFVATKRLAAPANDIYPEVLSYACAHL